MPRKVTPIRKCIESFAGRDAKVRAPAGKRATRTFARHNHGPKGLLTCDRWPVCERQAQLGQPLIGGACLFWPCSQSVFGRLAADHLRLLQLANVVVKRHWRKRCETNARLSCHSSLWSVCVCCKAATHFLRQLPSAEQIDALFVGAHTNFFARASRSLRPVGRAPPTLCVCVHATKLAERDGGACAQANSNRHSSF